MNLVFGGAHLLAAQEGQSHCSGASMTADAHEPPMNQRVQLAHLIHNGAHRAPLQSVSFTTALTERRYNPRLRDHHRSVVAPYRDS